MPADNAKPPEGFLERFLDGRGRSDVFEDERSWLLLAAAAQAERVATAAELLKAIRLCRSLADCRDMLNGLHVPLGRLDLAWVARYGLQERNGA